MNDADYVDKARAWDALTKDSLGLKEKLDRFWIALGERRGSVLPHDIAHMLDEFGLKLVSK